MATNSYNNIARITEMAMDALQNHLPLAMSVNREFKKEFQFSGAKMGDTISVRIPGFYTSRTGAVAVPNGYNDTYKQITVQQYGIDLKMTSFERQMFMEDGPAFEQNYIKPLMSRLGSDIEALGWALATQFPGATGTLGTAPTDFSSFLNAKAQLLKNLVPDDGQITTIFDVGSQASLMNGMRTLFNPSDDVTKAYRDGRLGRLIAGTRTDYSQLVPAHTSGPLGGSPTVTSAPTDGTASIVTQAWTASAANRLKAGDIVTFAGCYDVNPVTKAAYSNLKQFRVTADIDSDGSGNATITVDPAFILTGATQNISALPQTGAAVTPLAAASKTGPINLMLHRDAIGLVALKMDRPAGVAAEFYSQKMDSQLQIPIRAVEFYNGNDDTSLIRFDVALGWSILRPTFGIQVWG